MAYTIFSVPNAKRAELDAVLKEDRIARQSHKVRDAGAVGGPSGEIYVQIEGAEEAVRHAEELLKGIGTAPKPEERERLHRQFAEEDEAASAGMGLFFNEE